MIMPVQYYLQYLLWDADLATEVRKILDEKFLDWLEVLSLVGRVSVGTENLFSCLKWNKVCLILKQFRDWHSLS